MANSAQNSGKLIDSLELPAGLRNLNTQQLEQVCSELRDELIDEVAKIGGHFASSLGATELSVALHHVFNTPQDRIVWDVGHQCYVHKMLTGRRAQLPSIRKKDGLSGFLRRSESEYDTFGAGHAGTSISAAVGMSQALAKSDPERKVVAVIGDGSITAGMAFEALNHAGELGRNLIVVLNDNEMSISPNVGALSWLFSKAVTSKPSTIARARFKRLYEKGYVPELVYRAIDRAEEATQSFLHGPSMLFESFGFRYIGPIDGHNIAEVVDALQRAKNQDVPVLVHAYTIKGKGYQPAEIDPIKWHGVTPFDRNQGEFHANIIKNTEKKITSYTSAFADAAIEIAQKDEKVIALTAAMAGGTGLDKFESVLPKQFYDVGICEQHAVTFAAGMACEGYKPICAIYSTFLQRGYDQVVHDVCLQNLPVVFCMDRGGVVGNDGHTHQGVFDISFLRCIPNIAIMSPKDENELRHMLYTAVNHNGPTAIRYPRGNALGVTLDLELKILPIGKAEILRHSLHKDVLIIAFGPMTEQALKAATKLESEYGIGVSVINARFAKPLDQELFANMLGEFKLVCTLEDHALMGGFGSALLELINDQQIKLQAALKRFGVEDIFVPHASQQEQYEMLAYDLNSIVKYITDFMQAGKLAQVV